VLGVSPYAGIWRFGITRWSPGHPESLWCRIRDDALGDSPRLGLLHPDPCPPRRWEHRGMGRRSSSTLQASAGSTSMTFCFTKSATMSIVITCQKMPKDMRAGSQTFSMRSSSRPNRLIPDQLAGRWLIQDAQMTRFARLLAGG